MRTGTLVRLRNSAITERYWVTVPDPTRISGEEEVDRLSLDMPASEMEWLAQLSKYRNALAKAQGKRLARAWSRKNLSESLLVSQCEEMRKQMKHVSEVLGPLPASKDVEGMKKYAERLVAHMKKLEKSEKQTRPKSSFLLSNVPVFLAHGGAATGDGNARELLKHQPRGQA